MAEYYKFEIANWNEGTADLTLEQEAAYLRVINAIRLADQPITFNKFALCGLWRCNERKANRLLSELIEAGKLRIEGGKIINDKAVDDASNLRRLRAERASAGRRGGIESGKSRAKSLENNETGEAIGSTREEKRREEDKEREPYGSQKKATRLSPDWALPKSWGEWATENGLSEDDARREADRFRDYWLAKSGKDAAKLDWQATWRNWVRKAVADRQARKPTQHVGDQPPKMGEVRMIGGQLKEWTGPISRWMAAH